MMKRLSVLALVVLMVGGKHVLAEDKVDFEKQVLPILVENCGKCHGADKAAGKLRLHTAAALKEKWDAEKGLLVAGKPEESELCKRLVLPKDDKKRMPKGADPLAKEKIDLIARWIKEGAVLAIATTPAPAPAKPEAPKKAAKPELPKVAPAPKEAIDKLTAAGAQVMPLFGDSALLTVSFAHRGEPAGDAEVALLAGIAEQCYALNLAGAKPTDAGLAPLAGLKNLAELHLERATITDAGLAHVKALANLQYLNLYGTGITDAGLPNLKDLKHLERLYLWQTKVSYDPAMALEKETPGLMVNLGYNHPVVMKLRLTKELEGAKKQAEEAKADETKAQQALESAKKNAETVNARVADLEKQLKEAEAAAAGGPTAEQKAAAEKAAAEKAAAEKAMADKAAAEKAAKEKAAAEKAAADKAAADKAATEKAAEKPAAEKK